MTLRRLAAVALFFAVNTCLDAAERFETENFIVDAPTKQLAKTFGEYAEKYRQEKALDWLGQELPRWPRKCPLTVIIDLSKTGGATTFTFQRGRTGGVRTQEMKIFGETNALLKSVLPHEITHTIFAHHFGQAVPRWADEGGSVLSENEEERYRHDIRCREILNQGKGIKLRSLFTLEEYPPEMFVLYAQGYSITQFLVDRGGRQKFLEFVGMGLQNGFRNWEEAVSLYGFRSVDEMESTWLSFLKSTPPSRTQVADSRSNRTNARANSALTSRGSETRSSAVPGLPQLEAPVAGTVRGASPERERVGYEPKASLPIPPLPRLLPPEPPIKR